MFWSRLKNKKRSITGTCLQCGKCCRNIILFHRGKPVRSIKKFEKLVKKNPFYSHFYLTYKNPENGCLYFSCDRISSDNLCSDYVNRPEICKKYPQSEVFEYGGNLLPGCGYSLSSSDFSQIFKKEIEKKDSFQDARYRLMEEGDKDFSIFFFFCL